MPRSYLALTAAVIVLHSGLASAAEPTAAARQEHGDLILEGIPARDAELAQKLALYRQSRQATFLDWLPEGGMLVATRFGEVEQVHRITSALGMREQLTFFPDPVRVARAPRGGTGFAFLKNQGADDAAQVYYYSAPFRVQPLTSGKFRHGEPVWSNDGKRVAFNGTERDGASYDVYVVDIGTTNAPRLVAGGQQQDTWLPLDWSPDDRKLLLLKYVSAAESYVYIADVYTGTLTALDESGHKVGIRSAKFAPDGRGIYETSDEDGEFAQLRYVDPVSHEIRRITANIAWDIEDFDVSADGRYIAYVANDDGRSRLTVLDTTQRLEQSPAGLPDGVISDLRFDKAGRRLALSAESSTTPRDVYVYDLNRGARALDAKRTRTARSGFFRRRGTGPLSHLGSDRRHAAPDIGRTVSAAHAGPAPGAHRSSRRAGFPGAAALEPVPSVRRERTRLRRHPAECARIVRIR